MQVLYELFIYCENYFMFSRNVISGDVTMTVSTAL